MTESQSLTTISSLVSNLTSSLNTHLTELTTLSQSHSRTFIQKQNTLTQEIAYHTQTLNKLTSSYKAHLADRTHLINMLNDDELELHAFDTENTNIHAEIVSLRLQRANFEREIQRHHNEVQEINIRVESEEKQRSEREERYRIRADVVRKSLGFDVEVVRRNVCRVVMDVLGKKCQFVIDFENDAVTEDLPEVGGKDLYKSCNNFYAFVKEIRKRFKKRIEDGD
ncbi:hypothetical protein COBT_001151 [Conglomerata obtusa]